MNIVPVDKHDLESCLALSRATDAQVIASLDELLGWTADANWPPARYVYDRLKSLGDELVSPIRDILAGADDTWKYFLIVNLLPEVRESVFSQLESELLRIVSNPTDSEKLEEVLLEAKALLIERQNSSR